MTEQDQIDVRVRAQTGDLKQGMNDSTKTVETTAQRMRAAMAGAADQMRQSMNKIRDGFRDMKQAAASQMSSVTDSVRSEVSAMFGHFSGLFESLSKTKAGFIALAVVAAGAFMKKAVSESAEMSEAAIDLARNLGISATQAQVYRIAIQDIGATQGEFEAAAKGLAKQLDSNEERMNALGLKTRDAAGNFRPLNELVLEGIEVMNGYKAGTDRALAAQDLFGRGVDGSSKLLLLNRDAVNEASAAARELGLTVGENSTEAWKNFDAAADRAGFALQGIMKTIGDALMPVMTELINVFNAIMPAAITVLKGAIGGLVAVFWGLYAAASMVWNSIAWAVETAITAVMSFAEAASKALTLDWEGAKASWNNGMAEIQANTEKRFEQMANQTRKARDEIFNLFATPEAAAPAGTGGSKTVTETADPKQNRTGEWEVELERQRVAHDKMSEQNGTFHQLGKQAEADYWAAILQRQDLSKDERLGVERKYLAAATDVRRGLFEAHIAQLKAELDAVQNNHDKRLEIARQLAEEMGQKYGEDSKQFAAAQAQIVSIERAKQEQIRQIRSVQAESAQSAAMAEVEAAQQAARLDLELHNITKEQLLAKELEFEQKRYEISRQAISDRLSLMEADPDKNPVEYEKLKAQMLEVDMRYQAQKRELEGQMAIESMAMWDEVSNSFAGLWDKALQSMMNGTLTWSNANKALQAEMGRLFLKFVGDKARAWIQSEVLQTAWTKAQGAIRTALERMGLLSSVTATTSAATTKITAHAATAAAGAAESQASIPYVGPILAIAAMAAILASVSGLKGSIKSAAGGYDIPAGVNPVTQLHEQEMVLPARYANLIRGMASGEGGAASGSGEAPIINLQGTSAGEFFIANKREFKRVIEDLYRNNALRVS